jgi:hypothetical protein
MEARSVLAVGLLALLAGGMRPAPEPADPSVDPAAGARFLAAHKGHMEAIAAIRADTAEMDAAAKTYLDVLDALARRFKEGGREEDRTATAAEGERFAREKSVPGVRPAALPPAVLEAQDRLRKDLLAAHRSRQQRLVQQMRAYRISLLGLRQSAVSSDDDLEAEAITREITRTDARILEAEEALARDGPPAAEAAAWLPGGLQRGLVLYWPFDMRRGSRLADASGRDNHGTAHGAVWSGRGRRDGAYRLDGVDDFLEGPPSGSLRTGPAFTISLCVYREPDRADGAGRIEHVLSRSAGTAPDCWLYITPAHTVGGGLALAQDGRDAFHLPASPAKQTVALRRWAHLVFTCDGQAALIYVDGRLDKKAALPAALRQGDAPFYVGRYGQAGGQFGFAGMVDDLLVWDRALTEAEVLGLWVALKRTAADPSQLGPVCD